MPGSRDRDWPIPDRQRSIIKLLFANHSTCCFSKRFVFFIFECIFNLPFGKVFIYHS